MIIMDERKNIQEDLSSDDENFVDASNNVDTDNKIEDITNKQSKLSLNKENDNNTESDAEKFVDCDSDLIDDESQKNFELILTEEEKRENRNKAEKLKEEANEMFKTGDYEKSIEIYTQALRMCPVDYANERSILYANRGAAKIKLNKKQTAIDDCSKAIEFNPNYFKALLRRATLYEETDKLDESLEDYKKVVELDGTCYAAKEALVRLPPLINQRNEKLKTEMVSKLKDLGNMALKPFGLSVENFQMVQDPNTGSYSINFNQGNTKK